MSCAQYLEDLRDWRSSLSLSPVSLVDPDDVPEAATARVQMGVPDLGVAPITPQGPAGVIGIDPLEIASVFVSQENPWYEDWVVYDMSKIRGGGGPTAPDIGAAQIWFQKDGTTFLEALPGLHDDPHNKNFRWLAMEQFEYFKAPPPGSLPLPTDGCVTGKHCFEVYNVVDTNRFEDVPGLGVKPTGFLYRQFLMNSGGQMRFVDFWLLTPKYKPPEGNRRVALLPLPSQPRSARRFLENKGAILAPQGELTFVCIPVTAAPLPDAT